MGTDGPPAPALPFGFSALFFLQRRFSVIRPPEDFSLRLLLFALMLMDPMLTFRSLHLIDWADDGPVAPGDGWSGPDRRILVDLIAQVSIS